MSETAVSKAIADSASAMGYVVVRVQSGKVQTIRGHWMQFADKGTPDRILLGPGGRTIWVEVKKPGEQLSREQAAWHRRARAKGHEVIVCHSASEFADYISGHSLAVEGYA